MIVENFVEDLSKLSQKGSIKVNWFYIALSVFFYEVVDIEDIILFSVEEKYLLVFNKYSLVNLELFLLWLKNSIKSGDTFPLKHSFRKDIR